MKIILLSLLSSVALAESIDIDIAKRHFTKGHDLYQAGLYAEAIKEFETAHHVWPNPALDYNIARCHDRLEHWPQAVEAYERYLEHVPNAPDVITVRERIQVIRHRISERPIPAFGASLIGNAGIALPPPSSPATIKAIKPRKHLAAWLVGSSALAVGAVGAGLWGSAVVDYNALTCAPYCDRAAWENIPAREYAGQAFIGIAAALAITDVVLWVIERKHR